ncbi:MAG: glycosyl transferase [Spirochaetales bacterium]|nr:glycosyl transferase [Spirochaetales bacterium]
MTGGYYDNDQREYVITSPVLPSRWINYIGTVAFGGFIDHNGGCALCKEDPANNRITRYISQNPGSQPNGNTCYLRIKTDDGFVLFSPYYTPCLVPLNLWECRVGLSYSQFIAVKYGIHITINVFVPKNSLRVIHWYTIKNTAHAPIEADLVPVVIYSHFDALKNITNRDWVGQTMQSRLHTGPAGKKLLAQSAFMKKDTAFNFFCSSPEFTSFESRRDVFLGDFGYGSWQQPKSLREDELSNGIALGGENIGALMIHCGNIAPGESVDVITQLGQSTSLEKEWKTINHYEDIDAVSSSLAELKTEWDSRLSVMTVAAPDQSFSDMVNILLPHQCSITAAWSRDLSSFQTGFGDRGTGFRDACQDITGLVVHDPKTAKSLLSKLASMQCEDGHAMHQFSRLTMEAVAGDSREHSDRPPFYSDDHLWLIIAVTRYLKETGDMDFLSAQFPFYNHDSPVETRSSASLLEHLSRACGFTRNHTGFHDLPLLGFADWNDTVNLPAGAESVFSACLYGKALLEMEELFQFLGENPRAAECRTLYEEMKHTVNTKAWDGEWYIGYFDHERKPVGSAQNTYGKIFGHVQSWAILSGFADAGRAAATLSSVRKWLDTPVGVKLSAPGYSGYDPMLGGVSTYPPGTKENGGVFCHAHAWMIIAEAMCGNSDRAYELFCTINPMKKNDSIETYEMEPYCMSQNILSNEHPHAGKARNSWLTGTSAWTYRAAMEYIIGIKPDYQTLTINPCIPSSWERILVKRIFRGKLFQFEITNPDHIEKGIPAITQTGRNEFIVQIQKKEEK